MIVHSALWRQHEEKVNFLKFRPVLHKAQDLKTFSMIQIRTNTNNSAPKNKYFTLKKRIIMAKKLLGKFC